MTEEVVNNKIDFTTQYYLLRKKEGRIYSDQEVASLPEISKGQRYYSEWQARKNASDRLMKYLVRKEKALEIMEIGCGNGWLSAKLSVIPFSKVTGIDINEEEMKQAKRVFSKIKNLQFHNCSWQNEMISDRKFDIIIFAASVQYFPSLERILNDVLTLLRPGGEVHILDSHFYRQKDINAARQRSRDYFKSIGFPEMADHYFHHSINKIELYDHKVLYDPNSLLNRFRKNKNPFYWFCIKPYA